MTLKAKRLSKGLKVLDETNNALEWFPELKQFFENFQVGHMKITFENSKEVFMVFNEEKGIIFKEQNGKIYYWNRTKNTCP